MADDSNKTSGQEIDLDNIEVELLIICKNANALNQAAMFLTRRGWPTTVLSDISKSIEFIADKKPDYVLVSLSHPSASIAKLPDLITQTFNTPCIGFIETNDASSSAKLNQVRLRFKLQGQASGPSIHRTLRKILAERFHIESEDKSTDSSTAEKSAEGSSFTRVKGSGSANDGPGVIIQKSSASLIKNKGAHMIKGSDGDGQGAASPRGAQMFSNDEAMSDDNDFDAVLAGNAGSAGSGVQSGGPRGKSLKEISSAQGGEGWTGENDESSTGTDNELSYDESGDDGSSDSSGMSKASSKPRKSLKDLDGSSADSNTGDMLFGKALEGKSSAPVTMPTKDLVGMVKKSLFGESGEDITAAIEQMPDAETPAPPRGPQSILERAVEAAVGRVCQSIEGAATIRLEEIGYVGVFPVESESQPGYLVVVWQAPDQSAREAFLRTCESEIVSAFNSMNVPGKLQPGFWVQLPPVDFIHWAGAKASFTFTSAHQKREVGVAFFETQGPLPKSTPVEDGQNMHSIPLESLSTDQPVTFKAFIHFKNSGRYFLYLRNGRQLQPEQKQRLQGRQIEKLYMKHVDLENLRQYLATAYLCGLIIEFKRAA